MANEIDLKIALDRIDNETVESLRFTIKALLVSDKINPATVQASFDLYGHVRKYD